VDLRVGRTRFWCVPSVQEADDRPGTSGGPSAAAPAFFARASSGREEGKVEAKAVTTILLRYTQLQAQRIVKAVV